MGFNKLNHQAGVDNAWEQEKLEASLPKVALAQGKVLEKAADSHTSTARGVRRVFAFKIL